MQNHQPPLILSTCTLLGASFRDRVAAAASAGFDGIGLNDRDYARARDKEGLSDQDMRDLLDANGLQIMELEFVSGWSHGGETGDAARRRLRTLLEMSTVFQSRQINIGGDTHGTFDHVAESFGLVCDYAAPFGVTVALEPMPYTNIRDVSSANDIVTRAARPNAGVLVDSWHLHRAGALPDLEGLVPELVVGVQIDDAGAEPEDDLEDEGEHRRLLPGEGAIDLVAFLRRLWSAGINLPIGVEVISDRLQGMDPAVAAREVALASRRVLEAAMEPPV
jgi:sugar phosphate isomerase/epimerase